MLESAVKDARIGEFDVISWNGIFARTGTPKETIDTLNRGLSEDLLSEYIARLESEVGVTINQSALNQVVSGGAGDSAN